MDLMTKFIVQAVGIWEGKEFRPGNSKSAFGNELFSGVKEFSFKNFYFKNGCTNEFKNNIEKSCS